MLHFFFPPFFHIMFFGLMYNLYSTPHLPAVQSQSVRVHDPDLSCQMHDTCPDIHPSQWYSLLPSCATRIPLFLHKTVPHLRQRCRPAANPQDSAFSEPRRIPELSNFYLQLRQLLFKYCMKPEIYFKSNVSNTDVNKGKTEF